MKKAIGYIRVSTKEQATDDKFGIESQKAEILKFAEQNGYVIVEWLKDVVSGVSEHRPAWNNLLFSNDVANPPYEAIIVFKSDRVARDIKLYFYYAFLLERKGVKLVAINDGFTNIPDDFKNIIQSFVIFSAEQERKNITLRTSGGRKAKARKGGYAGGRVPYGYNASRGMLVINEAEATIVRMIFEMKEKQKMSMLGIADYLNDNKIMTKANRQWYARTILAILDNKKFYMGYYRYGGGDWIKGEHEAIIYEKDFN